MNNRSPAGRKPQPRLQALGAVQQAEAPGSQQMKAQKKSKRRELDPRLVKLFNEVRSEVGRIDTELPGGGGSAGVRELHDGATASDLAAPMQQVRWE